MLTRGYADIDGHEFFNLVVNYVEFISVGIQLNKKEIFRSGNISARKLFSFDTVQ